MFILDGLQHLNTPDRVSKQLVTVNINGKMDSFSRPFKIETFTSTIDKILSYNPKHLILCFSIRELDDETKKLLINYLKNKPNVFIQDDYVFPTNNFFKDPLFKEFDRFLAFSTSIDSRDKKSRRLLLSYDKQGLAEEYETLKFLGIETKDISHFKYRFRLWETDQIYFKHFKTGAFGSHDARDILNDQNNQFNLKDKTVLLGSFDEFSMSALLSSFSFSDKHTGNNFKQVYFPHVDMMANTLNTYVTGDYIKSLQNFNDLVPTIFILILLTVLRISYKAKIIMLLLTIPTCLFLTVVTYKISSFYLDFSHSIVLLFFLQYLGIPIIMLDMFREQESKKLQEINGARIDALLTVSEKVAHDIRSPLSAINLVAAKVTFPDSEYKEIFDGAVKRIDETATKILTQYRTKTGRENEQLERIDLSEIINEIVKEKKILNAKIDFEIVTNSETSLALAIKLDIERIVSNILDNSIFALKNIIEPKIFVGIEDSNNMISLSITDNGTGIPEQIVKLLGNERVTTKADTGQGNGIGLLHAKRVIERFNGKFEISSQENVGTMIKISLPKA